MFHFTKFVINHVLIGMRPEICVDWNEVGNGWEMRVHKVN